MNNVQRFRFHIGKGMYPDSAGAYVDYRQFELLYRELETVTKLSESTHKRNDKLHKAIELASHAENCCGWRRLHQLDKHVYEGNCDCWKRDALED